MTTTTWTRTPADLLGLGTVAVRPCTGVGVAVSPVLGAPVTPVAGTGLPFGGTAVRVRPQIRFTGADAGTALMKTQTESGAPALAHNYIAVPNDGTPLGIHPSGRPTS